MGGCRGVFIELLSEKSKHPGTQCHGTQGKRCQLTCYILCSVDKHVLNVLSTVGISPGSPPCCTLGGFQLHRRCSRAEVSLSQGAKAGALLAGGDLLVLVSGCSNVQLKGAHGTWQCPEAVGLLWLLLHSLPSSTGANVGW